MDEEVVLGGEGAAVMVERGAAECLVLEDKCDDSTPRHVGTDPVVRCSFCDDVTVPGQTASTTTYADSNEENKAGGAGGGGVFEAVLGSSTYGAKFIRLVGADLASFTRRVRWEIFGIRNSEMSHSKAEN